MADNKAKNKAKSIKTKPQESKAVSLSTLPTELIATIVEHALPNNIASTYTVHLEPYSSHISPGLLSHRSKPAPPDANRYAVVYVNKGFNAEAVRILQARQFRIEINEMSFREDSVRQTGKHWYDEDNQLVGYEGQWDWHMTFPGLDLRQIQGMEHFSGLPVAFHFCADFRGPGSCSALSRAIYLIE